MSAEADNACGVSWGERSPERVLPQRLPHAGLRHLGGQHRAGRAQAPLGQLLPGLAARAQSMGIGTPSPRSRRWPAAFDVQVEAFRSRPLDGGPYTYVAVDGSVRRLRRQACGGRARPARVRELPAPDRPARPLEPRSRRGAGRSRAGERQGGVGDRHPVGGAAWLTSDAVRFSARSPADQTSLTDDLCHRRRALPDRRPRRRVLAVPWAVELRDAPMSSGHGRLRRHWLHLVDKQATKHLVGQPSSKLPQCLGLRVTAGQAGIEVGPAVAEPSALGHGDPVQRGIDLAVAAPVEAEVGASAPYPGSAPCRSNVRTRPWT